GVGCARAIPPSALHTTFFPDDSHPTSIRVNGLSSRELTELRAAGWSADRWHQLLGVTVSGASGTFVAGRYGVDGGALQFVPAFPFDAGRSYVVRVDPRGLVTPRA